MPARRGAGSAARVFTAAIMSIERAARNQRRRPLGAGRSVIRGLDDSSPEPNSTLFPDRCIEHFVSRSGLQLAMPALDPETRPKLQTSVPNSIKAASD